MDDLIAFVTARLDEDEAAAQAASGDEWKPRADVGGHWVMPASPGSAALAEALAPELAVAQAHAAHIARHDPARALREVERKRGLLTDITVAAEYSPSLADSMLSELAGIWSDHPDYRPEWAPGA